MIYLFSFNMQRVSIYFVIGMENPDDAQQTEKSTPRGRKGPSKLPTLAIRQGEVEKRHVDFDRSGLPTGKGKDKFITFLGCIARSKVGIKWQTWKHVPQPVKDMIWEDVLVCTYFGLSVLLSLLIL